MGGHLGGCSSWHTTALQTWHIRVLNSQTRGKQTIIQGLVVWVISSGLHFHSKWYEIQIWIFYSTKLDIRAWTLVKLWFHGKFCYLNNIIVFLNNKRFFICELMKKHSLWSRNNRVLITNVEKEKEIPMPGIEPGPRGWKPRILTTRPHGRTFG